MCDYLYSKDVLFHWVISGYYCTLSMLFYSDCVGIVWMKSTSKLCLHQQEVLSRISDSFSELWVIPCQINTKNPYSHQFQRKLVLT